MQITRYILAAALISIVVTGCSQKSSTSTSPTSSEATAAAATQGSANVEVPIYPGATVKHNTSTQTAAGVTVTTKQTALTTHDSFDKVYAWYKAKLTGWNDLGVNSTTSNGQATSKTVAFKNANHTVGITMVSPNETWVSILETTQGQ